jgi:hypothetical protein
MTSEVPADANRNWTGSPNEICPSPVTAGLVSLGFADLTSTS